MGMFIVIIILASQIAMVKTNLDFIYNKWLRQILFVKTINMAMLLHQDPVRFN